MSKAVPSDAPPSYAQATGNRTSNQAGPSTVPTVSVTGSGGASSNNGIPAPARRSMEDEARPLPRGWVRTYDPESSHQFFVDTTKEPPRSIWHHPYDDPEYLSTLSSEERERLEQEALQHSNSHEAIIEDHTDDEDHDHNLGPNELPPRPHGKERTLGRKLKDKLTGTTHEQREVQRKKRAEQERQLYEQHRRYREAMTRAAQTGQPQLLGKDKDGKDIFVEPPTQSGYEGMGYGYSPYGYGGSSVYTTPTAKYVRPPNPYARPYGGYGGYGGGYGGYGYGRGYGGGFGGPLALGGGLLGGLLLADILI